MSIQYFRPFLSERLGEVLSNISEEFGVSEDEMVETAVWDYIIRNRLRCHDEEGKKTKENE